MTLDEIKEMCDEVGACWIWKGALNPGKSPRMQVNGERVYLRPIVFSLSSKAPKAKKDLFTVRCNDRRCISPECVIARSRAWVNSRTMKNGLAGNLAFCASVSTARKKKSKLSDEAVVQIRSMERPAKEEAAAHGISTAYVNMLRAGLWRKDYRSPFAGLGA